MKKQTIGLNILAAVLTPGAACACACGCGVFDVGTSSLMPERAGGTVFLNCDYQNQNQNWSGTSSAPGENNEDKKIETHTVTLGLVLALGDHCTERRITMVRRRVVGSVEVRRNLA